MQLFFYAPLVLLLKEPITLKYFSNPLITPSIGFLM